MARTQPIALAILLALSALGAMAIAQQTASPATAGAATPTSVASPVGATAPEAAAVVAAATVAPGDDAEAAGTTDVVIAVTPTREAPFERRLPAPLRRNTALDLRLWQWLALPILLLLALVAAAIATWIACSRPYARRSWPPSP
jgi:hypothetical protein